MTTRKCEDRRDPLDETTAPSAKAKCGPDRDRIDVDPPLSPSQKRENDRFVALCHDLWFVVLPNIRSTTAKAAGCWTIYDDIRMTDTFWLLRGVVASEVKRIRHGDLESALEMSCLAGSEQMTIFFVGEMFLVPPKRGSRPPDIAYSSWKCACKSGNVDVITWIDEHFNFGDYCLPLYDTIFHSVCKRGHLDMAQWLFERFKQVRSLAHDLVYSKAAVSGSVEMMKWILSAYPITSNTQCREALYDALVDAANANKSEMVKYLVKIAGDAQLDYMHATYHGWITVMDHVIFGACEAGNRELTQWLADQMPDTSRFRNADYWMLLLIRTAKRGDAKFFEWVLGSFFVDRSWVTVEDASILRAVCRKALRASDASLLRYLVCQFKDDVRVIAESLLMRCCEKDILEAAELIHATFGVRLDIHEFYTIGKSPTPPDHLRWMTKFVSMSPCTRANCRCRDAFWEVIVCPYYAFELIKFMLLALAAVTERDYVVRFVLAHACKHHRVDVMDWLVKEYSVTPAEIRAVALGMTVEGVTENEQRLGLKYLLRKAGVTDPWDVLDQICNEREGFRKGDAEI